ncbi:threonine-phosphate decarboxylase [Halalkaliarchaeum desulfuricum]|uniref:Aminotransferase n=1 Tax=Halalkaliarchaeum desulfuricum TaxID=2055893 RepID=A0A343TL47_9EURY|nr:aminotransferase class I/II-fold pyridoxal phosphate-dependent enzyme [Halalkaliarchaeum desulfuricum]AUX09819.1 threonine-phosphate decarboxylase [Halalkaliarchaeum desulfuricum]
MDPHSIDGVERAIHGGTERDDLLDFSANTNPRSPTGTRKIYEAAFDDARRYPDDGYDAFRRAAAGFLDRSHADRDIESDDASPDGIDPANVVVTPGGLAAIRLAVSVSVSPGDDALVPAPSFAEYEREVRLQGGTPTFLEQDELLETDPEPYALAVVCTPNNPTGELPDPARLREFARRCRYAGTLLLVDEAFLGFLDSPSLAGTEGVVVARSLTKLFGLPGIRVGYAVATARLGGRIETARRPWNLSTPAARVGTHCLTADLRGDPFVEETRESVESERERIWSRLSTAFHTVSPPPSEPAAPYVLFDVSPSGRTVDEVVETARDRGVAVRDARSFRGLDSHVRVAIKGPDANDRMLEALDV